MKKEFNVHGITCTNCVNTITNTLKKDSRISDVNINLVKKTMVVEGSDITSKEIENIVKSVGYKADDKEETKSKCGIIKLSISLVLAVLLMIITMLSNNIYTTVIEYLLIIPILIFYYDYIYKGIFNFITLHPNMDSLIAVSSVSAIIYSLFHSGDYLDTAAMIISLISLGKYIEDRVKSKASTAIDKLINMQVKDTILLIKGIEKKVKINDVKVGDTLVIYAGSTIPTDAKVISGSGYVNEAYLTGESKPVLKNVGDEVIGATILQSGFLHVEVEKIGKDTMLSKIIELVNTATTSKPKLARIVDKISMIFVPFILAIAIITYIVWYSLGSNEALNFALTTLVISCPCAIGLATPISVIVATGRAANLGILFKNARVMEDVSKIRKIAFDKTGTLTNGVLKISDMKYEKDEYLDIIYSIESMSEHILATPFKELERNKLEVTDFKTYMGLGIEATINGITYIVGSKKFMNQNGVYPNDTYTVYLSDKKDILFSCNVLDGIREDAKEVIDKLHSMKYEVVMITGDNEEVAKNIATKLGIDTYYANVMPDKKYDVITKLQENDGVIMVGDGINDSPALMKSNVGISFKNATDIAIESSDIILINDDLIGVIKAIILGKKVMKNIYLNLFWAFIYNLIGITLATGMFSKFGIYLNPMIAAVAMGMSSITVVLNSLRLRKVG